MTFNETKTQAMDNSLLSFQKIILRSQHTVHMNLNEESVKCLQRCKYCEIMNVKY